MGRDMVFLHAGGAEALNEPHQDTAEDTSTSSFNQQDTF